MTHLTRRTAALAVVLVTGAAALFGAAARDSGSTARPADAAPPQPVPNGVFRAAYSAEFTTLDYNNNSTNTYGWHGNLTVCTLLEIDRYGVIRPNMATNWTVSPDGLVYTFTLRRDVSWHTRDGAVWGPETAHDFVGTAQWMLTKANACSINNNLIAVIKNAREFFDGAVTDFADVGVRALDDYTLQYTLIRPTPYFLPMLTYASFYPSPAAFRAERGAAYGTSNDDVLYSGAYLMTAWDPENRRVYERNDRYWNAAAYPLARIEEIYNKEAATLGPELFTRGEIDETLIPAALIDEWLADPARRGMLYNEPPTTFTYTLTFNFEPQYGAEYGPDNWLKAVNNLAFRKSIYHAVNKSMMMTTIDPTTPDLRVINSIVLPEMFSAGGMDYTRLPPIAGLASTPTYNVRLAQDYKARAMTELLGRVTFPVKIVMPYNTGAPALVNRVQLLEQQLERDLGRDYVDVILVPYPATGFSTATRNAGVFSLMETNWGPDYADPMSVMDPFNGDLAVGKRYGRIHLAQDGLGPDGQPVFQRMLREADAEVLDLERRYTRFAEAERFLLDQAYVIPYYRSGYDYYVSRLDPFSGFSTQMGRRRGKYAGKALMTKPYTPDQYKAAEERYNREREEALRE